MAKKGPAKPRHYHELGEKLRALREFRNFTQTELAEALNVHINTLAGIERGTHRPLFEFLIALKDVLDLGDIYEKSDWRELLAVYELVLRQVEASDTKSGSKRTKPPTLITKHLSMVLNEELDIIERPVSLKPFYDNEQRYSPTDQIKPVQLRRLFAFNPRHIVPVITGTHGEQSSGAAVWSAPDQRAADLLQDLLDNLKLRRWALNYPDDEIPSPDESSMAVAGGPGSNPISVEVNQMLSTAEWFSGFYFSNKDPEDQWDWAIQHRVHKPNTDLISIADISDMDNRGADKRPAYRELEDRKHQDFGLLFIGPHPCNVDNWLVMAAGLRGMGTYAAAKALHDPDIVELIAQQLIVKRRYISGLVRYHFVDKDRERIQGVISSVCLTTGMVPES